MVRMRFLHLYEKCGKTKKSSKISLGAFSCEWQDSNLQPTGS